MNDYIKVKPSQISLYRDTALYFIAESGEGVLFKEPGVSIDRSKLAEATPIEVFIRAEDRSIAVKELLNSLNMELAEKIASKGIKTVRSILCDIVEEALREPLDKSTAQRLPETVEIMFYGFSKSPQILESLADISSNSNIIIEHTVNIMSLAMLYCCTHRIPVNAAKKIGLSAMLHDIGTIQINQEILNTERRLTEKEFTIYKTHPVIGCNAINSFEGFDETVARVALEHHEKIDGSGYPNGITDLAFESKLIGLIDSYEPLTYRDKAFRKAKKPYDALSVLKQETVAGRFNKEIFKNFCTCLTR